MSINPPSSDKNTSEDFWDLGDDDLELEVTSETNQSAPITEEPIQEESSHSVSASPSQEISPSAIDDDPEQEDVDLSSDTHSEAPPLKVGKKILANVSLLEKASLLTLVVALVGLGIRGILTFLDEAPQGALIAFDKSFPIKGEKLTIAEVETWWREPIRQGDQTDRGVAPETGLIPVARIQLDDSASETLQISFQDSSRESIGDTITLEVANGVFEASGSNEITVTCTKGFEAVSELNPYVHGDTNPWSVALTTDSGKVVLANIRIEPTFKE